MEYSKKKLRKMLFDYMAQFDDAELPDGAWQAMLEDAVTRFNEENKTEYNPLDMFLEYVERKA